MQKYNMSSELVNEEARWRLFFDPDDHPENTLKAFEEFIQRFELCYDALYPDPRKVLLEAAFEQWEIMEATPENPSPKPKFAAQNNIEPQKVALLHASSNPVETSMRPLGKPMKIAHMNKENEKDTLELLLNNYRDIQHPTTGLTPPSMFFRYDKHSIFPRQSVRTKDIIKPKEKDQKMKLQRTDKINE